MTKITTDVMFAVLPFRKSGGESINAAYIEKAPGLFSTQKGLDCRPKEKDPKLFRCLMKVLEIVHS
jgi:hypothetical protein